MKTPEEIRKCLRESGVESQIVTIVKNGNEITGFRLNIGNQSIAPVIYFSENEGIDHFVERAKSIIKKGLPHIDLKNLISDSYVRENVYLSIGKPSCVTNIIKRPYLNAELYLRLKLNLSNNEEGSIQITKELAVQIGLEEDELWKFAKRNVQDSFRIRTLGSILGIPTEMDDSPFFVIDSTKTSEAAVALSFPNLFETFLEGQGNDRFCYLIPSSTQEILVVPESRIGDIAPEILAEMVLEINSSVVDPIIQLPPVVYKYTRGSGVVVIAASCSAE